MKKLRFEELWLLSTKEKKAWNSSLADDVIAVVADNEFGKSSFVKSLYSTLGAEPHKTPESWVSAEVSNLLKFSIDDAVYFMLRDGPSYTLFGGDGKKLWLVNGITRGLAPKLAPMFDFKIELSTKNGDPAAPLPALCFMPFYIDQDNGWNETWEAFSGTGFIPNYKQDLADFHTGIRPKEYYAAKSERNEAMRERAAFLQERNAFTRAEKRIREKRSTFGFAFDPASFRDHIESLLKEQNLLQAQYDSVKAKVSEFQSQRSQAFEEVEISRKVLEELNADIKFVEKIGETEIHCPTCNTVHKNDFANRYGLMNDADACRTVLSESRARIAELDASIEIELKKLFGAHEQIKKISALLDEKRGEIKLGDMLRDESERMVDKTLVSEGLEIDHQIGEVEHKISLAESRMKKFENKVHKNSIMDFYVNKLKAFCEELAISSVPDKMYGSIRPVINEAGSSKPRLLLAYYYAILHTIDAYSTACFCPIVVDTPLQQDPDPKNAERMIRFAIDKRPTGSQIILATGNLYNVGVKGKTIIPNTKYSLLQADQYDVVRDFVTPFLTRSME
jgi:hypothetical protein